MPRTSELENLFFRHNWNNNTIDTVVAFTDPKYFLNELPDALSWCTHDIEALSAVLSLATNEDNSCTPSSDLVSDCFYALNHITGLMKALEYLGYQAKEQIREAEKNES